MILDDGAVGLADRHADPLGVVAKAAMYRLMVENTVDVIVRYNASLTRVYISPSAYEMLGYRPEEMMGGHASMLIHHEDFDQTHATFRQFGPALPNFDLTFRVIRKDGRIIWVEGRYRYLPGDGGALAVWRDVTERRRAETMLAEAHETLEAANRLLQTLARQDGLTGLANRRRLDEVLVEELRRARRQHLPLSVLLLDADEFKAYNDRYGHPAGDECLRRIGSAIKGALRRPADLAARYGGEEFVVLLPATDQNGSLIVAEHIRHTVAALQIEHLDSSHKIMTVSIGTNSLIPMGDGDHGALILTAADHALYRAKAAGRNRVVGYTQDALTMAH